MFDYLLEIKDFRRPQGQRISLAAFLEMVILAGISGRFGINEISRFIKNNEDYFIDRYNLQHGVPGKTTVFKILRDVSYSDLNEALFSWIKQIVDTQRDVWLAVDGKAIGSTVRDKHGSKQDYKSIVSVFCDELGLVLTSASMSNKESNEGTVAQELIKSLELKGVTFTMDALHCKKKPRKLLWHQEMIM